MKIGFYYDFRPVGQGLFTIGKLMKVNDGCESDQFTWVYDCGSSTLKATAITQEIEALRHRSESPFLDLLILSHFDNDHISGLTLLLSSFRVRRLVLPYFTPAERLLILLNRRSNSALLERFLAGPSAFIQSYEGGQETEVWFIQKSEGSSPDPLDPNDIPHQPVDVEEAGKVTAEDGALDPDLEHAEKTRSRVMLKDGSIPLIVWGHWEFCFYNLPQPLGKLEKLWGLIQTDFDQFFTESQNGGNPASTIGEMKRKYREVFGKSPVGRNDISLVTYTGPELSKLSGAGIAPAPLSPLYLSSERTRPLSVVHDESERLQLHFDWTVGTGWRTGYDDTNASLLYTGDITLDHDRVDELKKFLTPSRWNAIEVLQVPHHGAKSSWSAGLAAKFNHRYSVFSSARYHPTYRHPREEVLADLEDTTCVLVNELTGAVIHGGARWEDANE